MTRIRGVKVSPEQIVEDFENSAAAFSGTIRKQGHRGIKKLNFLRKAQPIQSGLETIGSAAFFRSRTVHDWNPFSQRISIFRIHEDTWRNFDEFERLEGCSKGLVECVHDLFHILLLEPFFRGEETIKSGRDFSKIILATEAVCYWMGEIFVTRKIQFLFPDHQPMFSKRRAASSECYHPYRVFQAEGICDEKKILKAILDQFSGKKGAMSRFKRPAGRRLRRQLGQFNADTLPQLYDQLDDMKIWTEYFENFCRPFAGWPLLRAWPLKFSSILEDTDALIRSLDPILRYLDGLDRSQKAIWRLRRRYQTRAYFAYSVLAAVRRGGIVQIKNARAIPVARSQKLRLENDIKIYLSALARRLPAVIDGNQKIGEIELNKSDREYRRTMSKYKDFIVARRERIYPKPPARLILGLADENINFSPWHLQEIGLRIEREFQSYQNERQIELLPEYVKFLKLKEKCFRTKTKGAIRAYVREANKWMCRSPKAHSLVSLIQDPESEIFHEVCFLYS